MAHQGYYTNPSNLENINDALLQVDDDADRAEASAAAALVSENNAAASVIAAQDTSNAALGYANAAQDSATSAGNSASAAYNNATSADTSATNAANSAANAANSDTNAATSATNAATSASEAAASAASINPANLLAKANNLSDVQSVSSARTNLGLGTAATANVTTSATDTTAGRLLKVGDFGLGSSAPVLPDLNTGESGFYTINNTTLNSPVSFGRAFISGGSEAVQVVGSVTDNSLYTRKYQMGFGWSTWVEVATSANSLGQGQAWQDVTGSRALGTTYTNSTGKPINVVVTNVSSPGGSVYVRMYCSGVEVCITGVSSAAGFTSFVSASMIVPNGMDYSVDSVGVGTLSKWVELR